MQEIPLYVIDNERPKDQHSISPQSLSASHASTRQITTNEEVRKAIEEHLPIVALESTIISHGMPYPENVQTALRLEALIRENGAVPATIAIVQGVAKVGLTTDEIEHLGKEGSNVLKCSRRDLAFAMMKGLDGACTVCATMQLAAYFGISVFATGGIGGVHRGAEKTWDVSADLREFSKSPVIVVCAGAKAILDLPMTMEYLETEGVPLVGYKTNDLPAFYSSKSGIPLEMQLNTAKEIAQMHHISTKVLQSSHGMLVANPIPTDKEVPHEVIDKVIADAVTEAEEKGISGKRSTPFLLAKIAELTTGKSLQANIALVENNVRLAVDIAKELNVLEKQARTHPDEKESGMPFK